jgi:hypothetical protein
LTQLSTEVRAGRSLTLATRPSGATLSVAVSEPENLSSAHATTAPSTSLMPFSMAVWSSAPVVAGLR